MYSQVDRVNIMFLSILWIFTVILTVTLVFVRGQNITSVYVQTNAPVTLTCPADDQVTILTWSGPDGNLYVSGTTVEAGLNDDLKSRLSAGHSGGSYTLTFTEFLATDKGLYVCGVDRIFSLQIVELCPPEKFVCANKIHCVEREYVCDGFPDCDDFSDETSCQLCPPEKFVCANEIQCLDRRRVCDGFADCDDRSDETSCQKEHPTAPTDFRVTDYTSSSITVEWNKGFNGGHDQTFFIIYRPMGGSSLQTVSTEQQQSKYTKEITGLKPNTRYQLNMYAYNEAGNSSLSSVVDIVGKTTRQYPEETTSTPNTASITLFVISALLFTVTASMFIVIFLYRRKIHRKRTSEDRENIRNPGVNMTQPAGEQHGIQSEGSQYDNLNLEERDPPSSYEHLGSNAPVTEIAQVSTDGRQMYESLGTRTNTDVYEDLEGQEIRTYENAVIR